LAPVEIQARSRPFLTSTNFENTKAKMMTRSKVNDICHQFVLWGMAVVMSLGLYGCDLLDVENPNALVEDELSTPSSINALANGAEGTVIDAVGTVVAPLAVVSDQLTWVGSYDSWKQLQFGQIDDPLNPEVEGAFAQASEARWMATEAVRRLENFQSEGQLGDKKEALIRSYLYAGIIYTWIPNAFDNFVISDKREAGAPIGEENMDQLYETAIGYLDKGVALAREIEDTQWETRLLAVRAQTKYSSALWNKLNPVNTDDPLVSPVGAVEDAQAVLDRVADDWEFVVNVSPESEGAASDVAGLINNRRELRFSDQYIQATADNKGVKSITFKDKIDDVVAPALVTRLNEILGSRQYLDFTVATAREMHLILAETALANNNGNNSAEFEQHINAIRSLDGLTGYSGQIPPREMLIHSRRVNLFLMGHRLADQYRFNIRSPKWSESADLGSFFPISETERRSNPNIN
jgi:hypothetical protein